MNSNCVTPQEEKSYFPLLVRMGEDFYLMSDPSKLPIGKAFVVWATNSSPKELDLAKKAYTTGFAAGSDAGPED